MKNINKQEIVNRLVEGGSNKQDAQKIVDANYDYITRLYAGQRLTVRQFASIAMTLGY